MSESLELLAIKEKLDKALEADMKSSRGSRGAWLGSMPRSPR